MENSRKRSGFYEIQKNLWGIIPRIIFSAKGKMRCDK